MIGREYIHNKNRDESGFSLIEVIIASAILAVGLLGLVALQTTMIRSNTRSYVMSQATAIASGEVELIRQASYATLAGYTRTETQTGYAINVVVNNNTPSLGAKSISVTVDAPISASPVTLAYVKYDDGS